MGNKIKKPAIDKIYKMMLSSASKGYFIDIARIAISKYCTDLSEDEIVLDGIDDYYFFIPWISKCRNE